MKEFYLLIIGDANHQYNIAFAKWLRTVKPEVKISIIPTNNSFREDLLKYYDEILPKEELVGMLSKIRILNTILRGKKILNTLIKNNTQFNTILLQFAIPELALWGRQIRKNSKNYTIAVWGSDYYRNHSIYFNLNIKGADNIIIGSPNMFEELTYKYQKQKHKFHLCYFGNSPIENLKSLKENGISRNQSCTYFDLDEEKINITVGHNGSDSHQHVNVLNELLNLNLDITSKIRVILPMTYGIRQEGYLEKIHSVLKDAQFEYLIMTDFMSDNDIAHLRNLTDIMINLQTTDAFSGSMREVLYCGGVVINGSWLPYQFLKAEGMYFEEVDKLNELQQKISDIVLHYPDYRNNCYNNPSKIYKLSSWSQTIQNWKEVIELQQ